MALRALERTFTPEEYLMLERRATMKSEYVRGQIYAMAGASRKRSLVTLNVGGELRSRLKGRPCEVYSNDMRLRVRLTGR